MNTVGSVHNFGAQLPENLTPIMSRRYSVLTLEKTNTHMRAPDLPSQSKSMVPYLKVDIIHFED